MSNNSEKDMLVSDERLIGYVTCNGVALWKHSRMTPVEVRDLYEAELTRLRSQLDEALGALEGIMELRYSSRLDQALEEADDVLAKHKPE